MAHYSTENSLGARLAAARRARGFRTLKELATAMEGTGLTTSVLQNIELGRRSNIDVSHLLNLAKTLRIPVISLLAPIARPDDPIDLPNLQPALAQMSAAEFDAWLSATPGGDYVSTSIEERSDRAQLEALRELQSARRELRRLAVVSELAGKDDEAEPLRRDAQAQLEATRARIEGLRQFLTSAGWDV